MSSPQRSPNHARPPGGTTRSTDESRTTGGRTTRKVQWLDDRIEAGTEAGENPTHLLDEYGLDMDAFERLTESLERHKKRTPLTQVHYYPPQPDAESSISPQDEYQDMDAGPQSEPESTYSSGPSTAGTFDSSLMSTRAPSPTYEVPNNYIDPEEREGLPGTKDLRTFSRKKAAKFVEAHLRARSAKGMVMRDKRTSRRRGTSNKRADEQGTSHGDSYEMDEYRIDIESNTTPTPEGRGLLSTILDLYDHPEAASSEILTESPGDESFTWSEGYTDTEGEGTKGEYDREPEADHNRPTRREGPKKKEETPTSPSRHPFLSWSRFGGSRPSPHRSDAGVFGALIASTGNLTGLAAPGPSRLQPNINRPGYRLSRYSADSKPLINAPPRSQSTPTVGYSDTEQNILETTTPSHSPTHSQQFYQTGTKANWSGMFKELPYVSSIKSGFRSGGSTPRTSVALTDDGEQEPNVKHYREEKKSRQKRKKAEVFITRHVAQIIQREEFIMKLTRAMMMFGGPPHRLQSQMQSAARVLDIDLSILYLPDIVLISFDDSPTGTSHVRLIRQGSSLDLGKLDDAYRLYWRVIHDKMSVSVASNGLDALMRKKSMYSWWQSILIGGMCASAICTISFAGSFLDAVICYPLGCLLVAVQMLSGKNILYSYVFEFTITLLFSFLAAAFAATHHFCYSAIASSSVVLILPGFLVLTGSLELMSRQIVSGSVRLCYAIVYALFLGFGFAMGAEFWEIITKNDVYGPEDYSCTLSHDPNGGWYQRTPSKLWAFLTVPLFSTFLSLKNQAPWNRKELPLLVLFASIGWVTNYFTGTKFVGQGDITAAVGAFAVGIVANVYARIFHQNAFVVMITGILFQLPSGLGTGGLLTYAKEQTSGSTTSYISGFMTAFKLVSVAIGLAVGLGLSLSITHPIQSRKREAGIFSL
ncbi:hypothetical protein BDQ12DRAFT_712934 [Crucibulum laeve]|uniref:DUF1212-domain-containing protein n=1 Tax=Crucibulum laeve TaxID=68775 RepID=A0A5C3LZP3_9AGAR|nr:hypothetical protein BDQ12DRAFT_712934 [Crucibulum laeve]